MQRRHTLLNHLYSALVLAALALSICATPVRADNNGGDGNNGGGGDGDAAQAGGVRIDPQGVLRIMHADPRVTMARLHAAKQALPPQLARPSKLRKVSLNRLEQAVAQGLAQGEKPTAEMVAMAGLTRLEYVFFYPESGDIVIAGPAEGFARDAVGRIVGVESGKPCILLDDVIIALRAYSPTGEKTKTISVSIDPTQEGLARMQETLRKIGGNYRSPADIPVIVNSLRQALGHNEVTIKGVPAGTHFAHVMTEADYRMKLIGIGLEAPPVPMNSYAQRMTGNEANSLVRWYFVPDYEAVASSEDGFALRMVGQGVKLVGEDELVSRDGSRKASGRAANAASRAYTNEFTKKFGVIAETNPVFSQLRNLVDLTIAAAFIQDRDFYSQANWDLGVFASEDDLPVEVFQAPQQVETAINAVMKGSRLVTPIGGGVAIQARQALAHENIKADGDGSISQQRASVKLDGLADSQWWWD